MFPSIWVMAIFIALASIFSLASLFLWRRLRRMSEISFLANARRVFRQRREWLEARFVTLASSSGKPRGLSWADCEFADEVAFARDRNTRELKALVAITIRFEAIEGGDMEDVEAVGIIREAAAVFHYRRGRWGTGGRPLFNMNPEDAITRLQGQFEPIET